MTYDGRPSGFQLGHGEHNALLAVSDLVPRDGTDGALGNGEEEYCKT